MVHESNLRANKGNMVICRGRREGYRIDFTRTKQCEPVCESRWRKAGYGPVGGVIHIGESTVLPVGESTARGGKWLAAFEKKGRFRQCKSCTEITILAQSG